MNFDVKEDDNNDDGNLYQTQDVCAHWENIC